MKLFFHCHSSAEARQLVRNGFQEDHVSRGRVFLRAEINPHIWHVVEFDLPVSPEDAAAWRVSSSDSLGGGGFDVPFEVANRAPRAIVRSGVLASKLRIYRRWLFPWLK